MTDDEDLLTIIASTNVSQTSQDFFPKVLESLSFLSRNFLPDTRFSMSSFSANPGPMAADTRPQKRSYATYETDAPFRNSPESEETENNDVFKFDAPILPDQWHMSKWTRLCEGGSDEHVTLCKFADSLLVSLVCGGATNHHVKEYVSWIGILLNHIWHGMNSTAGNVIDISQTIESCLFILKKIIIRLLIPRSRKLSAE